MNEQHTLHAEPKADAEVTDLSNAPPIELDADTLESVAGGPPIMNW